MPVDVSSFVAPIHSVQSAQIDANRQIADPAKSIHLSPSTAVRAIVNDLLQHYVSPPTLSSKSNKRTRNEGKYGEEITSSTKLNELKEKASKSNTKKRRTNSTMEMSVTSACSNGIDTATTAKRKRRSTKRTNESITSSQATRAVVTLQSSSSI